MTSTTAARAATARGGRIVARPLLVAAFWLTVWQVAAWTVHRDFLLASPWSVIARLGQLAVTADFWATVGNSLGRIGLGFAVAAAAGAAGAAVSARFGIIDALLSPAIATIRSTPVVSFIILVLLWADSTKLATITSFLMVLPVMHANVLEGIRHRPLDLLEAARVFRVPALRRLVAIDVPAVLPFFAAACRASVGLAWKSGVAAEVIAVAHGSIGERLYEAKLFLSSEDVFAWTAVIIAMSVACEALVLWGLGRIRMRLPGAVA